MNQKDSKFALLKCFRPIFEERSDSFMFESTSIKSNLHINCLLVLNKVKLIRMIEVKI